MTTSTITSTITVYTAAEVAEILRCDVKTVYRWARSDQIGYSRRPGQRAYRFTRAHIDEFLCDGPKAAAPAHKASKPSRNPRYSK